MILPAVSMLCQYPCAGPTMARWDSPFASLTSVVVKEATAAVPPAFGILTGVVVAEAANEAGVLSAVVQGAGKLALRITNQSNKPATAQGGAVKHEQITYP